MQIDIKDIQYKEDISNKNIAVYLNYALGSPPLELHISNIKDLLTRNNKITAYVCDGELKSCTANPLHSKSVCYYCKFRAMDGLKDIKDKIDIKLIDLKYTSDSIKDKRINQSLELGVMSSMASAVKAQSYEQLNDNWKIFHDKMLFSAKQLYNYFIQEIKENNYDFVFMFNGRFGDVKPVLEATRDSDIGYGLVEVKKSLHEVVFINELIHSIDGNTRRALKCYEEDKELAKKNAEIFFSKKVKNEDTGDPVYTKNQESGMLPEAIIDTDKIVIAIYPTTDDEYKFIGKEWDGFVPEDQVEEIEKLAQVLDEDKYILVVKMHPNQAHTAENVLDRYLYLKNKYKHIIVEEPMSKKDTYALMFKSDYVVNFASTIGVEACYAGKVVLQIGDTTFSKMDISYIVDSGTKAGEMIANGDLKPKSKEGAIIWGNYLATYADTLPSYKRVSNGDYTVDGRRIGHSKLLRILQLPAKLRLEINKPGFKFNMAFLLKGKDIVINVIKGKWAVK
jgi:hypothetical protein